MRFARQGSGAPGFELLPMVGVTVLLVVLITPMVAAFLFAGDVVTARKCHRGLISEEVRGNGGGRTSRAALGSFQDALLPFLASSSTRRRTTLLMAASKGGAAASRTGKKKTKSSTNKASGGFGKTATRRTPTEQQQPGSSEPTSTLSTASNESPAVVLDKWGLPPPTLDDVFPPLPPETELIPVRNDTMYKLDDMRDALRNVVPLSLDRHFDENGVERMPQAAKNPRSPMKLRLLHVSPPVLAIDNFFTPDECESTRQVATSPKHTVGGGPPVQVNSKTFEGALSKRTSTSWFCYYQQHPVLLAKAHHVLGLELAHMEEPQIVRYGPGQEFSFHYDQVPAPQLDNGGQRLVTLLVYLNSVPTSGGTMFRDLKGPDGNPLTVRPTQGSALMFFPADKSGIPDDRTLHCGEPLSEDEEKWIVQMWVHQRSYRASVPLNNRQDDAVEAVQAKARQLGFVPP